MKRSLFITCIVLLGLTSSCSSIDVLTYDQLLPADVFLPSQIKSVGVVNNLPLRGEPKERTLPLGLFDGDGRMSAEALAETLAESQYFDEVVICDSALQAFLPVTSDVHETKLSQQQVQKLVEQLGVDMVVSFEQLWVQISEETIKYPEWNAYLPVLQAKYTPVVRLYVPGRTQPMHTLSLTDSLFWNVNAIVSEKEVLQNVASAAAQTIGNKLVPSWVPTERFFFSGGSVEMRDAAVLAREGEWEEAQKIWEKQYSRLKKGAPKARSAYNLALSYEMSGKAQKAVEWLTKAEDCVKKGSQEEMLIKRYSAGLSERVKQLSSLNMQMSRFQDNF